MFQEYDLVVNSVRLNIATGPAHGTPLLMLHGVGRRWQDFVPIAPALAARRHLYLVDHRGHGKSQHVPNEYRVMDHVDDAIGVLATLHQPALLYGHSLGALVAVAVAALRPDMVQAIILEDPPSAHYLAHLPDTGYHATFTAMRALAGPNRNIAATAQALGATRVPTPNGTVPLAQLRDPASLRFVARCLLDLDGTALTRPLEGTWLDGYDEQALWAQVVCPTLLLRGDPAVGGMLPTADADLLATRIADCVRLDLPGVGHLLHWQATELTLRYTINFLESL
jgi:pimeloyl-ACP methyl ester carboxylesterase